MAEALLLDTCACLWLTRGDPMRDASRAAITRAQAGSGVHVAAITAWEVATLVRTGRYRLKVNTLDWFGYLLTGPGIRYIPLTPGNLIASAELPGTPPADAVDRMICAVARLRSLTVVTRDERILAYGASGYVSVLAC